MVLSISSMSGLLRKVLCLFCLFKSMFCLFVTFILQNLVAFYHTLGTIRLPLKSRVHLGGFKKFRPTMEVQLLHIE